MTEKKEEEKPVRTFPEGADASKLTGRKAGIIRSAILTGFLLVLIILAIRDKTPFPESVPQNRYWTDNIVDFLASYKEVIAVVLVLLYGLYRYVRIPRGIPTIVWTAVWAVLIPWLSFVCVEAYNKGYWHVGARVSYENASPMNSMFLLNMLLYYLFFAAMTFLLGGFFAGYAAAAAILMSIAIGNYYVQQFRGSPIVPWDFLSLRTAANVAGGFEYKIFWQMILATLGFVFLLLTIGKMKGKVRFLPLRIIGCVAAFAALFLLIAALQKDKVKSYWGIDTTLFTPNVRYTKNGFWPAFLSNISFLNVEKPDGYSVDTVEEIAAEAVVEYRNSGESREDRVPDADENDERVESESRNLSKSGSGMDTSVPENEESAAILMSSGEKSSDVAKQNLEATVEHPNIIVIMNEAFSDLAVLGDFNTSEDYMPNFRRLMEEYTSGYLQVSVKGGNTANTEYEFLSGDSMAFLPQGCVVFQQYIHEPIPTIATCLDGLGYETIGMHPYQGSGWERDRVYPLMGFDVFLDQSAFSGADRLRNYVSDKGAFDKVIELFENKEEGRSQFQFLVTMQNHSGYSPKDTDNGFSEEVLLTDAAMQSASVVAAERYLTLIKYSDAAFGELIEYFEKNVTEPTIIVMFGDHEPNDYVTEVIDELVGNESFVTASDNSGAADATEESLEDVQKHYQVPFIIWNNFGVPKDESVSMTSVNYLNAMIMEEAGLPLSEYQMFLLNLQKKLPVIAAGAYMDADGTYHSWAGRKKDEENRESINEYNILEYNHLIDVKNRVTPVFLNEEEAG